MTHSHSPAGSTAGVGTAGARFGEPVPHFLGIGAMRAGSSWLARVLREHPEIWLPPLKELHYFDTLDRRRHGRKLPRRRYGRHLKWRLRSNLRRPARRLVWDLRYFIGEQNDRWYRSLFAAAARRGYTVGEITPAYAVLSPEGVRHVRSLNPAVKLIYILRDPIERTWSEAVRALCRKRNRRVEDTPPDEFLHWFHRGRGRAKSEYAATLATWEAEFPPEQLLIGFFEEIRTEPAALVSRVCSFLEVGPFPQIESSRLTRPQNVAAGQSPIPPALERACAETFLPDLQALAGRFGPESYPAEWLARAERALREAR